METTFEVQHVFEGNFHFLWIVQFKSCCSNKTNFFFLMKESPFYTWFSHMLNKVTLNIPRVPRLCHLWYITFSLNFVSSWKSWDHVNCFWLKNQLLLKSTICLLIVCIFFPRWCQISSLVFKKQCLLSLDQLLTSDFSFGVCVTQGAPNASMDTTRWDLNSTFVWYPLFNTLCIQQCWLSCQMKVLRGRIEWNAAFPSPGVVAE